MSISVKVHVCVRIISIHQWFQGNYMNSTQCNYEEKYYLFFIFIICCICFLFTPYPSCAEDTISEVASPDSSAEGIHEGTAADSTEPGTRRLFEPLMADPRWPHFSIAYHYYTDDEELKNVGATSFGETLPLFNGKGPLNGEWGMGIQAAVFAIFDLDAPSYDLINADYWVGIPFEYRVNALSGLIRIYHQSSHIGDEYLLRNRIDRVNLSYESVDVKLSYDLADWFRVYSGAGYLIRKEPKDLKPWSAQFGFEIRSPRTYLERALRPIAGVDIKTREELSWRTDISLKSGVEFYLKRGRSGYYKIQFTAGYFNGYSPNGQFYERQIEYLSLGSHFYFD